MALFGGGGDDGKQLHEELKYLATSIETINQQLSNAQGGGVTRTWLEGTDRKIYTIFQLVQETEKKLLTSLEAQSSLIRRDQQGQMGKLIQQVNHSFSQLTDEFSKIRSEIGSMRESQDGMRSDVRELVSIMRDQIALMREEMELMKRIERS